MQARRGVYCVGGAGSAQPPAAGLLVLPPPPPSFESGFELPPPPAFARLPAAQNDSLWLAKALERYPASTVHLQHYPSYQVRRPTSAQPPRIDRRYVRTPTPPFFALQALVRDDNAAHAALLLPLPPPSCRCRYKLSRPGYHFECLPLALEWHRGGGAGGGGHRFRLYLEARGEADLRSPGGSSLGFLVHRAPPPDRCQLERRLLELASRWGLGGRSCGRPRVRSPVGCQCRGHLPLS